MKTAQSFVAAVCSLMLVAPPSFGEQGNGTSLSRDNERWYSGFTRKYTPNFVPPINVSNSTRLDSLIRAGRIYLSLQDAIALAIENNLDVEIQRYGPRLAEASLLRTQAGGLLRGVNTQVNAGPSSAASNQVNGGGSANGFTSGGGGGGGSSSGSGTIITSTGTNIPTLDEYLSIGYQWSHRTQINSNATTTGVNALVYTAPSLNIAMQKGFLTGTNVTMNYNSNSVTANSVAANINPVKSGAVELQVSQRLLQGFGIAVNNRNIRQAKNNVTIADLQFQQQLIATVSSVINLYSDLVSFIDNVNVARQSLALNEKLYSDNKKQVEIGTLAPIEIVRAEAEVARSQQDVTTAETQVLQQETILKNYLSRTGLNDPLLAEARVVPTDRLRIPENDAIEPIQDMVQRAIAARPEIRQTDLNIENSRINLQGSKSQLLPALDLVMAATNNGLAGAINSIPIPAGAPYVRNPDPALVGGLGTVWSQILGRRFPDYSIGFQLTVPLRNRSAQADMALDQLTIRQGELRQRQQVNQIRVDVQNAVIGVQQARARYQAAVKSRVLQQQTLDAEQKKYTLGASTIFFVIQAQRDLALAEQTEVAALSAYNRSRVSLDQATGDTLKNNNVSISEALQGRVSAPPTPLPVDTGGNGASK